MNDIFGRKRILFFFVLLTFGIVIGMSFETKAAKKKKTPLVTYTLKKGTLTISGKGKMPENMKFSNNQRIQKITVKKGVTSISANAFSGCKQVTSISIATSVKTIGQNAFSSCKKLAKLTLPGNFSLKLLSGDDAIWNLTENTAIDTITFNTSLNINNISYLNANNLEVRKSDPAFRSIEGVIYSKDGKSLVRVPSLRKELSFDKGCTEFCLQAVLYCSQDYDMDPENGCRNLKNIVIPYWIKTVNADKYRGGFFEDPGISSVEIQSAQLDGHSIIAILRSFQCMTPQKLLSQLPDQIICDRDLYMTKDDILIAYTGRQKEVTIPEGVKEIGESAFYMCESLETIQIPDSVTKIGARAFFDTGLKTIKLPEKLTVIEEETFANSKLTSLVLPDAVTTIKKNAFAMAPISEIQFGNQLTEIQSGAFDGSKWKELTLPATLKKIGSQAFGNYSKSKKITIQGSSKNIGRTAFFWCKATLYYTRTPKEWKTNLQFMERSRLKKGMTKTKLKWNRIQNVSGYQLMVSTSRNFLKNKKTANVKGAKTSANIRLKAQTETIYARIRPYKIVKGKKVYGRWSSDYMTIA